MSDGALQPLLRIRRAAQALAGARPGFLREQERRELTKVEVVNDAQGFGSNGSRAKRPAQDLALALRQRRLDLLGGPIAERGGVHLANDSSQRAFGLCDSLPDNLSAC